MKDAVRAYAKALDDLDSAQTWLAQVESQVIAAEAALVARRTEVVFAKDGIEKAQSAVASAEAALLAIVKPPVVVPPVSQNVRGALGIAFDNTDNVPLYANRGSLVIAGRKAAVRADTPVMQAVRAGGGEVLQYIVPADIPDGLNSEFDREYYGGFGAPAYWPFANRSKWPNTRMADMTPDSAWLRYTVEWIVSWMTRGVCDGMFLDTVGARTYASGANWDSWSAEEKDQYMLGNIWLVRELRQRLPNAILVSNSVWYRADKPQEAAQGEQYVNGVCLEHHASTSTWHRNYAARAFGVPNKRRVLVIANSQEDAREWFNVPGVTHVSGQTTPQYTNPLAPAVASVL